jgi:sn-glycerol 3-phosphate transport system substrate-binding protein
MQVFDVGTGVMMARKARSSRSPKSCRWAATPLSTRQQYLPGIVSYYSKPDGTMLSFPYNSSSPILYYNKDIFDEGRAGRRQPAKDLGRRFGTPPQDQDIGRCELAAIPRPG